MSEIVIHGTPGSPYLRAAIMACIEKQVPYRLRKMAMGESRTSDYLARNPFGRIPSIEHDGFRLYETQAILRYVDAAFPGPALAPTGARSAARMNQVIGIVDWYFFRDVSATIGFNRIVAPLTGLPTDEAAIATAIPKAEICIKELAHLLGDQPFLAGDDLSLADLMLAPQASFAAMTEDAVALMAPYPALCAWLARMESRESMRLSTWDAVAKAE
jgi:glutathione S-transferase